MKLSKNTLKLLAGGLFMAFGRYPISWLLSSGKKSKTPKIIPVTNSSYIPCSSGNVWYAESDGMADAQIIVFLHGLNASGLQWFHQRNYFRKKYHLIFLDLPGHGKSKTPAYMNIDLMAKDLAEILMVLKVKNPILYGHSLGGMVTMKYAALINQPAVSGIIVQHSSYTNPFRTSPFSFLLSLLQEPVIRPYLEYTKRHRLAFSILSRINYYNGLNLLFYRFLLFTGSQSPDELRFLSKISAFNPSEVIAEGILKTLEFDVADVLKNIKVPALILGATQDQIIQPSAGKVIASKIKNAKYLEVASGHLSLMEHAVELNVLVNNFMETYLFEQTANH